MMINIKGYDNCLNTCIDKMLVLEKWIEYDIANTDDILHFITCVECLYNVPFYAIRYARCNEDVVNFAVLFDWLFNTDYPVAIRLEYLIIRHGYPHQCACV